MVPETKVPVANTKQPVGLPMLVVGPIDIGRLIRELEAINGSLQQLALRQPGTEVKMPKTSQLMDQMIQLNKLNLLQADERQQLLQFLQLVKAHAPVLHISFSADPSPAFVEKLMTWLRHNIHPQVLLTIGLQPNIGAGCVVRSTNKYFDCSLRQDFIKQRAKLASQLFPELHQEPAA